MAFYLCLPEPHWATLGVKQRSSSSSEGGYAQEGCTSEPYKHYAIGGEAKLS
jgi:hypothetical protein